MVDRPDRPSPASITRRRLLIAGAFTAVGGAAVARLPEGHPGERSGRQPVRSTSTVAPGATAPTALPGAAPQPADDHTYDILIENGRVIDPDIGLDQVMSVGIDGDRITGLGASLRHASLKIDAKGLVVSPGFIDVLSYEPELDGAWYKIADGVTTNLGMHGMQQGVWAEAFFARYAGKSPVHFGGAFSDHWVRFQKSGLDISSSASPDQISMLAETLEAELAKGWLGVCFEPEYTPGVTTAEITALAEVAHRHGVPCFFHGRYSSYQDEAKTVPEIIEVAKSTGAAVHIAHLPSTGGTWQMEQALAQIDAANEAGHDVTACLYPYDYWATYLGSARFAPGWQERFRIGYDDLQVAGTDERVTASSFGTYQSQNKLTVAYAIPEESVRLALQHPKVMIGSDAILDTGNNHPRATGTFSRVLGKYVREDKVLSLTDALAKMTILPARRLEAASPTMRRKGRLQRGADADLCIFDPDKITDRSTVSRPAEYSEGIRWVLTGGTIVKAPDGLRRDQLPGTAVKSRA